MRGLFLLSVTAALGLLLVLPARPPVPWWKGNTHTHTLWSDGDAAPEHVGDVYKRRGYHFLVISDHNVQMVGEKWVKVGAGKGKIPEGQVADLEERFGAVELRGPVAAKEMRLRTLDELRARFEGPGFIFIPGEEITDRDLHHVSMNHTHVIDPAGGPLREAMARTVAAVEEAEKKTGRPMLVHLNHPNFKWAVTPDDIAHVLGERFFEVYNGHRGVRNYGDAQHPSMEETWDYVLTKRLSSLGGDVLYGLAVDDAHNYHKMGLTANPFRGWIQVRAPELTADAIVRAMKAGDFYASSGVTLKDVVATPASLSVRIAGEKGVRYQTRYVGTRKGAKDAVAELFALESALNSTYAFKGDELYVRAVVVSNRKHPNGYDPEDFECAWTQPVRVTK